MLVVCAQLASCSAAVTEFYNELDDAGIRQQPTGGSSPPAPTQQTSSPASSGAAIQAMLDQHNDARAASGLAPLRLNAQLTQAAQRQAAYNAQIGKLSHQDASGGSIGERVTAAGYSWRAVGENIAYASSDTRVFNNWMSSDGHRRNIMNGTYRDVGLARVTKGERNYWCAVFAAQF